MINNMIPENKFLVLNLKVIVYRYPVLTSLMTEITDLIHEGLGFLNKILDFYFCYSNKYSYSNTKTRRQDTKGKIQINFHHKINVEILSKINKQN